MTKDSILDEIDSVRIFCEVVLRNTPDKQTARLRVKHLKEIAEALDDQFENRQIVYNATSSLHQFLAELQLLYSGNKHQPKEKVVSPEGYEENITMTKHVISTLRLHVLLSDLTAIVNNN